MMAPKTLTLKQRLAALSTSPSMPNSPQSTQQPQYPISLSDRAPPSHSVRSPRRKAFNISFTPPWIKNTEGNVITNAEIQSQELVQEVMSKLIFQAGVDYETRPMVVINASALPDPKEINYDVLLSRTLSYLNLYVESDYTVVFLAAGGKHSPGWNWVWKAYRSLSRKYRKNLKRLFVVHSSFFTKMLFSLAGAIISPKFFRKIIYIDTLSELAYHLPLTQINIPPAVYQESEIRAEDHSPHSYAFEYIRCPLEDIMGFEGEKGGIPRVIKDAIQFLRDTGVDEEGLFRRSPSSAMLRTAQEAYDRGNVVSLETFGDPHLAAVLLKKYLRDLPSPIFPESLYPVIRRCPMPTSDPGDMASVSYVRENLLPELAPCTYILLSHVLHLMHEVSLRSASNRMDAHNLSVVLCPNLISGSNPARDVLMCTVPGGPALFQQQPSSPTPSSPNRAVLAENKTTLGVVIKLCIQRYYEIFDEVIDRNEAAAVKSVDPAEEYTSERSRDGSAEVSDDETWSRKAEFKGLGHSNGASYITADDVPSLSLRSHFHQRQSSGIQTNPDEDEDIDDAMLVMPIGPSYGQPHDSGNANGADLAGSHPTSKPRRSTNSNGSPSAVRSVNATPPSSFSLSQSVSYATYSKGKARSTISIEKRSELGHGTIGPGRKGSISIGKGTLGKSIGSGVTAVGITAEGFFAPPSGSDIPPVPPAPSKGHAADNLVESDD
ncbi:hypothetical protein D9757_008053 [Collybiopsis confluens]|uniref:Rho-GAP domain-containing protein n=1 Tax=Collybiopsis confluens TaxID=2823264 RepID=A0A8H5M227_9AGAR|nr:hypothetical protein D9757_008053 [Collybiopsis confluens]